MLIKLPLGLILLGCLFLSSCAVAQNSRNASSAPEPVLTLNTEAVSIPIETSGNLVFLQVRVNGSAPLWFILDSGAEGLLLDSRRVKELGLRLEGKSKAGGAGENSYDITFAKDVTVSLAGMELTNQTLSVTSLASIEPTLGRTVDGIIGYHLLSRFVVEIDYAARLIKLYKPQEFQYSGKGEIIPITFIGGHSVVSVRISLPGRESLEARCLLDTGASSEALMTSPFVESQKLLSGSVKTIREPPAAGLGGDTTTVIGRLDSLKLGRFILERPIVDFARDRKGALARTDIDGIIGGEVFRRFRVIFDYSRQRIILEPNSSFPEPYEATMSGIHLWAEGSDFRRFIVHRIVENSPASEVGLREGDQIISINGQNATSLTLYQLKQMFGQEGKEYILGVKRGRKIQQVKIKMRRLI
ncbi:MAG TPA: aspartyl protease family protein [Pyrinomonadaceae bacterium]|nr:aspartyl protease family protein [Pyrinomonadaceae bacterium]